VIAQYSRYEKPDTLFSRYAEPIVSKHVYDRLENDGAVIYFACYFQTDTAGKIASRQLQPLYQVGNRYRRQDSVFSVLAAAIAKASASWAFRILTWRLEKDTATEKLLNSNPAQRPFGGMVRWLIIYEFSGTSGGAIDKISFVKEFAVQPG